MAQVEAIAKILERKEAKERNNVITLNNVKSNRLDYNVNNVITVRRTNLTSEQVNSRAIYLLDKLKMNVKDLDFIRKVIWHIDEETINKTLYLATRPVIAYPKNYFSKAMASELRSRGF